MIEDRWGVQMMCHEAQSDGIFVALENEHGTVESDNTSSVTRPEWERKRVQTGKLLNALTRISSVLQNQGLDRVSMWQANLHVLNAAV